MSIDLSGAFGDFGWPLVPDFEDDLFDPVGSGFTVPFYSAWADLQTDGTKMWADHTLAAQATQVEVQVAPFDFAGTGGAAHGMAESIEFFWPSDCAGGYLALLVGQISGIGAAYVARFGDTLQVKLNSNNQTHVVNGAWSLDAWTKFTAVSIAGGANAVFIDDVLVASQSSFYYSLNVNGNPQGDGYSQATGWKFALSPGVVPESIHPERAVKVRNFKAALARLQTP